MTVSVCMATYNGEKYIEEQMASILHQTKRADEVIICDDNSTDGTREVIDRFIERNSLQDRWKLYCNEKNRGYPGNFYYAMSLCTQDIIFLADQDDVWDKEKLERMCDVLGQKSEIKAVCCKFGLVDEEGRNIHAVMVPTRNGGTGNLRKVTIEDVFYKCEWPGMVVAYRNTWYRQWGVPASQNSSIPHDFLICARAAEENAFGQMDEELAWHRRHESNAGGEEHRIGRLLNKKRKLKEIEDYLEILEGFRQGKVLRTEAGKSALVRKYKSMRDRYEALQSGKVSEVIKSAKKHRGDVRLATFVCDLLIVWGNI